MSFLDSPGTNLLARYLDLAAMRQSLITSNIANVDTPGYRTRDIDFHGELERALQGDASDTTEPVVREVQGLIARPDGNNVSLERETMALARVQLQYRAGVELLRNEIHTLQSAINEGK